MNVNPSSEDFGMVVPWDSLTEEQRQSGDWILLPDVSGEPQRARRDDGAALRRMFDARDKLEDALRSRKGSFDATGKAR